MANKLEIGFLALIAFAIQYKMTLFIGSSEASFYASELLLPLMLFSRFWPGKYILSFLGFIVWVLINFSFLGYHDAGAIKKIIGIIMMLAYFIAGMQLVDYFKDRWLDLIRYMIVTSWFLGGLLLIYQLNPVYNLPVILNGRFAGLFNNANAFGMFYVFTFIVSLLIAQKQPILTPRLDIIGHIISLACLFYSGSRSAFITFALAMILSLRFIKIKMLWVLIPTAVLLAAPIVLKNPGASSSAYSYNKSIWKAEDDGVSSRITTYENAYNTWMTSPLTGIGLGNYYNKFALSVVGVPQEIHNTYLAILTELGIVGLVLFGLLPMLLLYRWRHSDHDSIESQILFATLVIGSIGAMANDLIFQRYLWLICGVCAGAIGAKHQLPVLKYR